MVASIARRICLLALTAGVLAASLPALAQPDWVTALRSGGYSTTSPSSDSSTTLAGPLLRKLVRP